MQFEMKTVEEQNAGNAVTLSSEGGAVSPAAVLDMKRGAASLRKLTGFAVLLLIAALVLGIVPRWHARKALAEETRELAVPNVTVISPKRGELSAGVSLPAEIKPFSEATIYARANGYIHRWLVDIGDHVEKGQLLAEIDTPEVDQDLVHARAEVAQMDAALALAKSTAQRWNELLKTASVSEQETAEKQSDLLLKSATLDAGKANVRRLEEMKSFSRVTAPFDGAITARGTDLGELITAGSGKEIFHIVQTRMLRVFVRVPQPMARGAEPGRKAELSLAEFPQRKFEAKVVRAAGAMEANSRTLLVELEVDNSKGEILAGSYGQIKFAQPLEESPLTIPANTLLFREEGMQVGIVHPDGKVELRKIRLGRDLGKTVEVLDGLTPADSVIVNPSDSLIDGTIVRSDVVKNVAAQ